MIENRETHQAPEARWREANEAYLAAQAQRLRLLIHRRVLWLRSRWQHDPLQNYQGVVVSEAEVNRLLAGEDRKAEASFWLEDPEAAAIGRSISDLEEPVVQAEASAEAGGPPALEMLVHLFGLTPFERDVLLLCLAPELDPSFERLYAYIQDDMNRGYATPHLGLALFGGDAEPPAAWGSFAPEAPLRRFHLVLLEPGQLPGTPLGVRPLRLDERVAGYLRGISSLDDRVAHLLRPLAPAPLAPIHRRLVEQLIRSLGSADGPYRWPALNLTGAPGAGKGAVALALCDSLGLRLYSLVPERLPSPGPERQEALRLLEREAVLHQLAVYVPVDESAAGSGDQALDALVQDLGIFLIIGSRERQRTAREMVAVEVPKPDKAAQRALWHQVLAHAPSLNGAVEAVVQQFDFGPRAVAQATLAAEARARLRAPDDGGEVTADDLWQACREHAGWHLDELAQRVVPCCSWEDIVLPEDVFRQLQEIAGQVANRPLVYEEWGFGARLNRGRGLSALFSGASGTGKTMAAEVLANRPRAGPVPDRPGRRGEQVHRRDGEEPPTGFRQRRAERGDPVLRRGRCPLRQAHRGEGRPRPLRQHRDQLPAAADGGVRGPGHPGHQPQVGSGSGFPSAAALRGRLPLPGYEQPAPHLAEGVPPRGGDGRGGLWSAGQDGDLGRQHKEHRAQRRFPGGRRGSAHRHNAHHARRPTRVRQDGQADLPVRVRLLLPGGEPVRDPMLRVDIDRIILTGLEVTPYRAEHIRTQVEAELQHRLQREGLPQGLASGQMNRLHAPEMHLAEPHSDSSVAGALAGNISHALRDTGSSGRR